MKIEENNMLEIKVKSLKNSDKKIAIILPYFNELIGLELYENCSKNLKAAGVKEENIELFRVGGSLEIPLLCQKIINTKQFDAIISLGIVIRGETNHFDLVCEQSYRGLMDVQLKNSTPITFGIITCETPEQAASRVSEKSLNKGKDFAFATLLQLQNLS